MLGLQIAPSAEWRLVRLNWDALALADAVKKGAPVDFLESTAKPATEASHSVR
jgi:hypothetical protein